MAKLNWQDDVIPSQCIHFRLDKKQGNIEVNGINTHKEPTAQEIIDSGATTSEIKPIYKTKSAALKAIRREDGSKA